MGLRVPVVSMSARSCSDPQGAGRFVGVHQKLFGVEGQAAEQPQHAIGLLPGAAEPAGRVDYAFFVVGPAVERPLQFFVAHWHPPCLRFFRR